MQIELQLTAERDELPEVIDALSAFASDVEVAVEGENSAEALDLPTEQEYVLRSLREHPEGAALRIVHRTATELDDSPFNDHHETDGWNEERRTVRSILYDLQDEGLVQVEGQTWYPVEDTE